MSNVIVSIIHAVNVMLSKEQEPAEVVGNVSELLNVEQDIIAQEVDKEMRKLFKELEQSGDIADSFLCVSDIINSYASIVLYCNRDE
jgi:hypothetical protein